MYIINPGGNQVAEKYQYAMPVYPYDTDTLVSWLHNDQYLKTTDSTLYWDQDADSGEDPSEKAGWGDWFASIQNGLLPQKGVDIHLGTEATALVMDDDRVVGIKASCKGEDVYFHAKTAVLLTAGDFSNNRALFKKYCNRSLNAITCLPGWNGNTGEALRMAVGAGADIAGHETIGMTDCAITWNDINEYDIGIPVHTINCGQTVASQPWMRVNSRGERVAWGAQATDAVMMANPDTFVCFDDKWRSLIPENYFKTRGPYFSTSRSEKFQKLIDQGCIQSANTIEELEQKLGLASGVLSDNVVKWNQACTAGKDWDEFDSYDPSYLVPIDTPPYYGVGVGGTLWAVKCGVRVNENLQVISTKSRAIPGLYASFHTAGGEAGELTHSFMSITPYGQLGMSFVGGYLAADAIVAAAKA